MKAHHRAHLHRSDVVSRFIHDNGAIAAVEFALVFPVMLLLLLGATDLTDALAARRKVTVAAFALSDLTAQQRNVDATYANSAFTAVSAIMEPYSDTKVTSVVSSIVVDKNGNATVAWSLAKKRSPYTRGFAFVLPKDLKAPNSSLIVAEIRYTHTPILGYAIMGKFGMSDIAYSRPRVAPQSSGVTCSAPGC